VPLQTKSNKHLCVTASNRNALFILFTVATANNDFNNYFNQPIQNPAQQHSVHGNGLLPGSGQGQQAGDCSNTIEELKELIKESDRDHMVMFYIIFTFVVLNFILTAVYVVTKLMKNHSSQPAQTVAAPKNDVDNDPQNIQEFDIDVR
jgi:large-conductance mechanosensitive channel